MTCKEHQQVTQETQVTQNLQNVLIWEVLFIYVDHVVFATRVQAASTIAMV